jgi:hypothetical protein
MATLGDYFPVPPTGVDYTTWTPSDTPDYSDSTGFTIVNNVGELATAMATGGDIWLNDGTYDLTDANYIIDRTTNYRLRGQSKAGVILLIDNATTSPSFSFVGSSGVNMTATLAAPAAYGTDVLTGDFQAQGVVVGDYVKVTGHDAGDDEREILIKINAVDASTVTLDNAIPAVIPNAETVTVINFEDVHDGNFTLENLSFDSGTANDNSIYMIEGEVNNGYAINNTVNDCILDRSNINSSAFSRWSYMNNWTLTRCTMTATDWLNNDGLSYGYGTVFVDSYFDKVGVNFGGEGYEYYNCYFYDVRNWNEGGFYERCFFEKTTPAGVRYDNMKWYDAQANLLEPRYIDVPHMQDKMLATQMTPSFGQTQMNATNGESVSRDGILQITFAVVVNGSGVVQGVPFMTNDFNVDYVNGQTRFTYIGTTHAGGTLYIGYSVNA